MKKLNKKEILYISLGCIILFSIVIGATFAYFQVSANNNEVVKGTTNTTTFSLNVDKITTADNTKGLIPMKNSEAPNAAEQLCFDNNGNVGCQIYKITVEATGTDAFFIDGYINTTTKENVETRFTRVYPEEKDENGTTTTIYKTHFTNEDLNNSSFNEDEFIKTGNKQDLSTTFNSTTDANCLLVQNEQIGADVERKEYYFMIWVYDNEGNQNFMQGMVRAFAGNVTFITSTGNEIKAIFD